MSTPEVCQAKCHKEEKCYWWTWVPGKERGRREGLHSPLCLMKTKKGFCGKMRARFDGTISGPRDCGK